MIARDSEIGLSTGQFNPGGSPIDLDHLARQTMDDVEIQREVLKMFSDQVRSVVEKMGSSDAKERFALAHSLKGSARSVGAFALADCAEEIESRPEDETPLPQLSLLADKVRDFIASLKI
ncbi:Hpt domain-containing protein [Corticibacterium sp. UT-5YL-CI-8]|nr:Hpt domain-containing protein [Tianweitania sp. UT-5YL-CI-8]